MIRLRPHHLLCMLTFAGRGYTPRFTLGLSDIVARLGQGEEIVMVEGPDDICAGWLDEPRKGDQERADEAGASGGDDRQPHCHEPRIAERDRRAAADIGALLSHVVDADARLRLDGDLIARLRAAFQNGTIRSGCAACEWKSFCDQLSESDFAGCRLGS